MRCTTSRRARCGLPGSTPAWKTSSHPGKRLVHALELAQLQRVGSPAGHAAERGEGGGRIAEKPPRGIGRIACRR